MRRTRSRAEIARLWCTRSSPRPYAASPGRAGERALGYMRDHAQADRPGQQGRPGEPADGLLLTLDRPRDAHDRPPRLRERRELTTRDVLAREIDDEQARRDHARKRELEQHRAHRLEPDSVVAALDQLGPQARARPVLGVDDPDHQ